MILILLALICITFMVSKSYLLTGAIIGSSIVYITLRKNESYLWSTFALSFSLSISIISLIFNLLAWCILKNQLIIIDILISILIASLVTCVIIIYQSKDVKMLKITLDREGRIIGSAEIKKYPERRK